MSIDEKIADVLSSIKSNLVISDTEGTGFEGIKKEIKQALLQTQEETAKAIIDDLNENNLAKDGVEDRLYLIYKQLTGKDYV